MAVDADNRDAAVGMFRAGMTQEALDQHWTERHAAEPVATKPTLEQSHSMIGQMVAAA